MQTSMQTFETRLESEDEEKIVTKKPYSAPILEKLDLSLTENAFTVNNDGVYNAS